MCHALALLRRLSGARLACPIQALRWASVLWASGARATCLIHSWLGLNDLSCPSFQRWHLQGLGLACGGRPCSLSAFRSRKRLRWKHVLYRPLSVVEVGCARGRFARARAQRDDRARCEGAGIFAERAVRRKGPTTSSWKIARPRCPALFGHLFRGSLSCRRSVDRRFLGPRLPQGAERG